MSNRPQMLLMVPDTTDFRADLAKFGIADRFEIADVKPETRPTPDQLERAEIILSAWVKRQRAANSVAILRRPVSVGSSKIVAISRGGLR